MKEKTLEEMNCGGPLNEKKFSGLSLWHDIDSDTGQPFSEYYCGEFKFSDFAKFSQNFNSRESDFIPQGDSDGISYTNPFLGGDINLISENEKISYMSDVYSDFRFAGKKYDFANHYFGNNKRVSDWQDIDTYNLAFNNIHEISGSYKIENDFLAPLTVSLNHNSFKNDQVTSKESDAFIPQRCYGGVHHSEIAFVRDGNIFPELEEGLFRSENYFTSSEIPLNEFGHFGEEDSHKDCFSASLDNGLLIDKKSVNHDFSGVFGVAGSSSIYLNSDERFFGSYNFARYNVDSGLFSKKESYWRDDVIAFKNFETNSSPTGTAAYFDSDYFNADFTDREQSGNKIVNYGFSSIDELLSEERQFNFNNVSIIESLVENDELIDKVAGKIINNPRFTTDQTDLLNGLKEINPDLAQIYSGTLTNYQLEIDNYLMLVAHSLRELISITLRVLAPDEKVKIWLDNRENKLKGARTNKGPTRKGRLFYLFRNHSKRIRRMMTKEADCIYEIYQQLNKPSHTLPDSDMVLMLNIYLQKTENHLNNILKFLRG